MRIGVDIDEVLCMTNKYFIDYFNKKYNTNYDKESIKEYNYKSFLFHDNDFVIAELKNFIDNNLEKFEIIQNAKKVLTKFKEMGLEIVILTSRSVKLRKRTIDWLKLNFGEELFDEFLIYNGDFDEEMCKSKIAMQNKIDVLIEDAPHYAINTSLVGIPVLLFDCPWNRSLDDSEFLIRVKNWDEIDEKMKLFL